MTFSLKQLRVTFALSGPSTFSNGTNTLQVTGLRTTCSIQSRQFPAFPEADVSVYGMLASDMNTLTTYENQWSLVGNSILNVTRNTVIVEANAGSGWTTVFAGQLINAQPTYISEPDVALRIKARVLYYESLNTVAPTSYTGSTDVATMISNLAARIGAAFTNDGVSGISLSNPYFPGTLGDQLTAIATHAHIGLFYDYGPAGANPNIPPINIVITPKGKPRSTAPVTLTPQSGLVSTPTLDSLGWVFARAEYNAGLRFGGSVTIAGAQIPRANANWYAVEVTHLLDAVAPNGNWFTDLHLSGINPYAAT